VTSNKKKKISKTADPCYTPTSSGRRHLPGLGWLYFVNGCSPLIRTTFLYRRHPITDTSLRQPLHIYLHNVYSFFVFFSYKKKKKTVGTTDTYRKRGRRKKPRSAGIYTLYSNDRTTTRITRKKSGKIEPAKDLEQKRASHPGSFENIELFFFLFFFLFLKGVLCLGFFLYSKSLMLVPSVLRPAA